MSEQRGSVLVEGVMIEGHGHLVWIWSDDDRVTWAECGCPRGGIWKHHGLDAQDVADAWSAHAASAVTS